MLRRADFIKLEQAEIAHVWAWPSPSSDTSSDSVYIALACHLPCARLLAGILKRRGAMAITLALSLGPGGVLRETLTA